MAYGRQKFIESLAKLLNQKEDRVDYLPAKLGRYSPTDGSEEVVVSGRNGFVYARVRGSESEIVEAFNDTSAQTFDLAVLLVRDKLTPNYYRVASKDITRYAEWSQSSIAKHGPTHSFDDATSISKDIAFIYKRQLVQPFLCRPQDPANGTVYVEPDFYFWNTAFRYFAGESTASLLGSCPTDNTLALFVTVYIAGSTNSLGTIVGSTFSRFFPPDDKLDYIPYVSPALGIPVAAIYLTADTVSITWDDIYDIRTFLSPGGLPTLHDLNPTSGFHTGALPAGDVSVADPSGIFTATELEDVLSELYYYAAPIPHDLDPVGGFHTGSLPAEDVSVADPSGVFSTTNAEDVLYEIYNGVPDRNARVAVRIDSGANVGVRRRINFISSGSIAMTGADDAVDEEIDLTFDAVRGYGKTGNIAEWTSATSIQAGSTQILGGGWASTVTLPNGAVVIPASGTAALGTGAANYVARWNGANTLTTSIIQDNGTTAAIGVASIASQLLTIQSATATNTAFVLQTTDNTVTKNLQEWKTSAGTNLAAVNATGQFGIGGAPAAAKQLYVFSSLNSAASKYGVDIGANCAGTGNVYGLNIYAQQYASNSNVTGIYGANIVASLRYSKTAVISGIYGVQGQVSIVDEVDTTPTITNVYGLYFTAALGRSVVTNAYGLITTTCGISALGSIGTAYGVYIDQGAADGTVTTQYGLRIISQTRASTNYGIYTGLGLNVLGDQLAISGAADRQQLIVTGYTTQTLPLAQFSDAVVGAGVHTLAAFTALGSGANADGGAIALQGKSSTTAAQSMGLLQWDWETATHATSVSRLTLKTYLAGVATTSLTLLGGSATVPKAIM